MIKVEALENEKPEQTMDTGTAYGIKQNSYDPFLTEVGPGTPMGELLRRYWHPIAIGDKVTSDLPKKIRILGEDLVLFRDGEGKPGLVAEHCCHRGTSLAFGRIENDGIRCCYHGWKFDVQGRCLDMACEVDGGRGRKAIRQPWYPVQERYGAVWAYMGPPEKKPELPRWEVLEGLEPDEFIEHSDHSLSYGHGDVLDFNWLQSYENIVDPLHAVWLHITHSEEQQFGDKREYVPTQTHDVIRSVKWGESERGVSYVWEQPTGPGTALYYTVENIMPNVSSIPNYVDQTRDNRQDQILWHIPVDDTHFFMFVFGRVRIEGDLKSRSALHKGKRWQDLTDEERQRWPGDYEAQRTQGQITVHANEHLNRTDEGVVLTRRRLAAQAKAVQAGEEPLNIVRDPNTAPLATIAGQIRGEAGRIVKA